MATQTQRLLDSKQVLTIMNRRLSVPTQMAGQKVRLTIRGNGTLIDVTNSKGELVASVVRPGEVFQKVIYNTDANSGIAQANATVKQLSKDAMAAERAGNKEEAHKLFNEFLNRNQISFSVPTTSPLIEQLGDRVDIIGEIVMITTENGSLLTVDPNTIRVAGPVKLSKTVFSFDEEAEGETVTVDGKQVDTATGEVAPTPAASTAEELAGELQA